MWEEPSVMHFGKPNTGFQLQAGMTFTIEPMLNLGKKENVSISKKVSLLGFIIVFEKFTLFCKIKKIIILLNFKKNNLPK